MRNTGEVHHRIHAGDQRRPVNRSGEIGLHRDFDTGRKLSATAVAHRGAHVVSGLRQRGGQRPADEAGRPGHEHSHRFPRAKLSSTHATSAPPSASVARSTRGSGSIALTSASVASATLSTNTRTTISCTEKPPSVAR